MSTSDRTSESAPSEKRKPRRTRFVADYVPLPDRIKSMSWLDRVRRDIRTGGWGLVISLALHGIAIFALGFIIIQSRTVGDGDPMTASWLFPSEKSAEKSGRRRVVVDIPVDVGSMPSPKAVEKPTTETGAIGKVAQPGVNLADVSNALEGRSEQRREGTMNRSGGSPDAERAIKLGLSWLAKAQLSDGRWELHQGYPDAGNKSIKTDTGATALALLAFLGHGHTHRTGAHSNVVAKGLRWLQATQDPKTGDLHDMRFEEGRKSSFYAHSMATIVLCEALALTGDVGLKDNAEKAVQYLIKSQHPKLGGWKYRPFVDQHMVADLSVTGWALMALHTGRMAGLEVPREEFVLSSNFLDSVRATGTSRYKYEPTSPDNQATQALTSEAILCRQWLGWPKDFDQMTAGVRFVTGADQRPEWAEGRRNVYAWYYTSQMLHNIGGDDWKKWNSTVKDLIVKNQSPNGSWHPTKPKGADHEHGVDGGRLYITSLCILILETPYRHRPLYADE